MDAGAQAVRRLATVIQLYLMRDVIRRGHPSSEEPGSAALPEL